MSPFVRPLTVDDLPAARALGGESFGRRADPEESLPTEWPPAGRTGWGVEVDGRIVATAYLLSFTSWFGGREVSTAGIAGVGVAAEQRGRGLLTPLVDAVLDAARADGHVVSTLYPTAPGIYRRFGYELVGELTHVSIPTSALAGIPAAEGVTLRRATEDDVDAIRAVYDAWAATQNGPLTRRGVSFEETDAEFLGEWHGTTLALDPAGTVVGYASWDRTDGYDPTVSTVAVGDLIGLTGAAQRALWRFLGGFTSVTATVRLRTSGDDLARLHLPAAAWLPVQQQPYQLAVLDVAGAFAARGLGPLDVTLPFTVEGAGSFVLEASGGTGACTPGGPGGPVFTRRGLALAWAGVQPCAALRQAGLLSGPDTDDALWDALLGGRRFGVRDYF